MKKKSAQVTQTMRIKNNFTSWGKLSYFIPILDDNSMTKLDFSKSCLLVGFFP
jgi:hypothetical protein